MKRILAVVLVVALLAVTPALQVFSAQGTLAEVPGTQLIVNGKSISLKSVVLSMNNEMLVPVNEFITALGIPAGGGSIKWDSGKKTVKVTWKSTSAVFKPGSKYAAVNGKSVDMGNYCITYSKNNKVYVPLKYTAGLFGTIIVTDSFTKGIYICEKTRYEKNLKLLKTMETRLGKLNRLKVESHVSLDLSDSSGKEHLTAGISDKIDLQQKILYSAVNMPVLGTEMKLESVYLDNSVYSRNTADSDWDVTRLDEEDFDGLFRENTSFSTVNTVEILAAGLVQSVNPASGKIQFEGAVYPQQLLEGIASFSGIRELKPKVYSVKITAGQDTELVEQLAVKAQGSCEAAGGTSDATLQLELNYLEPDGDFQMELPVDIPLT